MKAIILQLCVLLLALNANAQGLTQDWKGTPEAERLWNAIPGAKFAPRPARARKILLVTANPSYFHSSIPAAVPALTLLGEKTGLYSITRVIDDLGEIKPEEVQGFDGIIFLNTVGEIFDGHEAQLKEILRFVEEGKGLIAFHGAADCCRKHPAFLQMIGAEFVNHPWDKWEEVTVFAEDPFHPLTRHLAGKQLRFPEEIYQFRPGELRRRAKILLRLNNRQSPAKKKDLLGSGQDFPLTWIKRQGKGRVFYSALGHNDEIYYQPALLEHFLAGIQYALGDLKVDDRPSAEHPSSFDLQKPEDSYFILNTYLQQGLYPSAHIEGLADEIVKGLDAGTTVHQHWPYIELLRHWPGVVCTQGVKNKTLLGLLRTGKPEKTVPLAKAPAPLKYELKQILSPDERVRGAAVNHFLGGQGVTKARLLALRPELPWSALFDYCHLFLALYPADYPEVVEWSKKTDGWHLTARLVALLNAKEFPAALRANRDAVLNVDHEYLRKFFVLLPRDRKEIFVREFLGDERTQWINYQFLQEERPEGFRALLKQIKLSPKAPTARLELETGTLDPRRLSSLESASANLDLDDKVFPWQFMAKAKLWAKVSNHSPFLFRSFDGDPATRWTSNQWQTAGDVIRVDFGRERELDTLVLSSVGSPGEFPRELVIRLLSEDQRTVTKVHEGEGRETLDLSFPNVKARFVELELKRDYPALWSVNELRFSH